MKLIPEELHAQMLTNSRQQTAATMSDKGSIDHVPVVKLFTPDANCTWLLTELDEHDPDMAFGLCDLGQGEPELGYVYLPEIQSVAGPLGLKVERDIHFKANKPLSEYAKIARAAGRIVT